MDSKEKAFLIGKLLSDKKALDTVIIDIKERASFADYLVIASGSSLRHVSSLADDCEKKLFEENLEMKSIEGKNGQNWVLIDSNDVIINIFNKEMREKYNLEKVWGDCEIIQVEE